MPALYRAVVTRLCKIPDRCRFHQPRRPTVLLEHPDLVRRTLADQPAAGLERPGGGGDTWKSVLSTADKMLYRGKASGRDCVVLADAVDTPIQAVS